MKVIYILNTNRVDGCVYYRNYLPAMYLTAAGLAEAKAVTQVQTRKVIKKDTGEQVATEYNIGFLKDVDVVVFNRFYSLEFKHLIESLIRGAKEMGCKVVYEADDDVINIPIDNPVAEGAIPAKHLTKHILNEADAFTVTTSRLGEVLAKVSDKPYFVLPNSVELFRFESEIHHRNSPDEVRIGWAGGRTHGRDIKLMFKDIKRLLDEYENVTFVALTSQSMEELIDFKHEYFPFVSVDAYPSTLASLDIDIALIPLRSNKFNQAKSQIKWVEFSAVGAATVYSDVPPYSDHIEDGVTGLAVKDGDWYTPMKKLINDVELRKELAEAAYREVAERYDMEKNISMWHKAYQQVLSLPK